MTDTSHFISVEIDIAYDADSIAEPLFDITSGLDTVSYRILTLSGPGGGWPCVRFTGRPDQIATLLFTRYCPDDHETAVDLLVEALKR